MWNKLFDKYEHVNEMETTIDMGSTQDKTFHESGSISPRSHPLITVYLVSDGLVSADRSENIAPRGIVCGLLKRCRQLCGKAWKEFGLALSIQPRSSFALKKTRSKLSVSDPHCSLSGTFSHRPTHGEAHRARITFAHNTDSQCLNGWGLSEEGLMRYVSYTK